MKTCLFCFALLTFALHADNWNCWTVQPATPILSPSSLSVACAGPSGKGGIGAPWTQNATWTVQLYDLQTNTPSGAPQNAQASGGGNCTAWGSPYTSQTPTFSTTVQVSGSTIQWNALVAAWKPVYSYIPGTSVMADWSQQSVAVTTVATVTYSDAPCQCFQSDCCNPAIGTQCPTTCSLHNCKTCTGDSIPAGLQAALVQPANFCTPILFDVANRGFSLSDPRDGVSFDVFGDGQKLQIAWPTAESGNGWLVLPDAYGQVTSFAQFFGNLTPQPPAKQPNGFLALAVYDLPQNGGNGDGIISAQDSIWKSLRIWVDANHDGVAQRGELLTLNRAGILWISLSYQDAPHTDEYGNQYRLRGTVCDLNSFARPREAIWDVWLQ